MDYQDDIPREIARAAHSNTSWDPDRRADEDRRNYAQWITEDLQRLSRAAKSREDLERVFGHHRQGLQSRWIEYLTARSRCASSAVVGPANFPVARNEQATARARRLAEELDEHREQSMRRALQDLDPTIGPIRSGSPDAVDRLETKLAEAEAKHAAATRKSPNLSAKIRRLRQRLEAEKERQATPAETIEGQQARLEIDTPGNRVRIYYPDGAKPAPETIAELKASGFRWAPSLKAWSAYCNPVTIDKGKRFADVLG